MKGDLASSRLSASLEGGFPNSFLSGDADVFDRLGAGTIGRPAPHSPPPNGRPFPARTPPPDPSLTWTSGRTPPKISGELLFPARHLAVRGRSALTEPVPSLPGGRALCHSARMER